jgi:hypothetical protein
MPRKKERKRKKKNPPNQRSWRHIDLCHLGYATQIDTGYLCCFFRFYFQGDSGRWSRWRAAKKVSHTFLSKKKKCWCYTDTEQDKDNFSNATAYYILVSKVLHRKSRRY